MKALGIITGIAMMVLGFYAVGVPFQTFLGLGWLLGVLLIVNGVEMAVRALGQKKKDILQGLLSIVVVIGGITLLCNFVSRFMTDVAIAYLIGICVIVYGIEEIIVGTKTVKTEKTMGAIKLVCGILSLIAGVFAVMHPFMTMFSVGYIIAFSVVFQGVDIILLSFSTGKKKEEA